MGYTMHTLKVVLGLTFAYLVYLIAIDLEMNFPGILILGVLFIGGLFITIHGLFTGIEAAITAVDERPSEE